MQTIINEIVYEVNKYNFRRISLFFEKIQYSTNFRVIEASPDNLKLQHINSKQIIVIHEN